jgi:hypothetical protein
MELFVVVVVVLLAGCDDVIRVKFHHCPYMDDEALSVLIENLSNSLKTLEITSCGDVTDSGLKSIARLRFITVYSVYHCGLIFVMTA